MSVRVRFAPSPTGHLHIGGARTALFNWLFARREKGAFVLRIEDTDERRSSPEMVDGILEGLRWLKIDWDEGPYFQSERCHLYAETARTLLNAGAAYRDFSSADAPPDSHRESRGMSDAASLERAERGMSFAVRFKTPSDIRLSFTDLVFGEIAVESERIEDFVILRSDGKPTYHLSVVTDDLDMGITHVIRGADHLPNTAKHVLLYRALGKGAPVYAHLPLILGPDKNRLSKRHGATSVTEFAGMGLLPEAVRNYIALLGWSPGDDSEILSERELIERFDLSRVNRANAVFDPTKLAWMNKRYLSSADAAGLEPRVRRELEKSSLWREEWAGKERGRFLSIIDLIKTRVEDLRDFPIYGRPFFTDDFEYEDAAVDRHLRPGEKSPPRSIVDALRTLRGEFERIEPFDLEATEGTLRRVADEAGLKAGQLIGAVRVAATGRAQAPGIFEVLATLGRARTLDRLDRILKFLEAR
jgi:glutamyl-tRNA synthetase